jgi:uridine kinase
VRLARRGARDVLERGRIPGAVRRQFKARGEPMGRRFVEPQRRWATGVVTSPVSAADLRALLNRVRVA